MLKTERDSAPEVQLTTSHQPGLSDGCAICGGVIFGGRAAKKKCKIQPTGAYRVGNKRVEQFVTVAGLDVCLCCVKEMLLNLSVSKQKVDLMFPHQQTTHGRAGDLSANRSHFQQSQRIIQMDQTALSCCWV